MRYKINLFPPPKLSIIDKAVFFSYNYLRYILVITQLVVLGVFTYRFTVDQEIVDLKDKLRHKQGIVKISSPLLNHAALVDERMRNIKSVITKQDEFNEMVYYYLGLFPASFNANRITLSQNEIYLEGTTNDVLILQSFYNRLKKEDRFEMYELSNLQRKDVGYTFVLTVKNFNT